MLKKFPKHMHLQKAQQNVDLSQTIGTLSDDYRDWQITTLFYSAVHWLQAYFSDQTAYYPQTHQERDGLILKDGRLGDIWRDYRELKQLSVSSRYMCWPMNQHDVELATNHLEKISTHLGPILDVQQPDMDDEENEGEDAEE